MTQAQWIVLCFRVVVISGFLSIGTWIAVYTKLAPWWRNPVGRSLVIKAGLIALLLVPTALALFIHFSRLTSETAAWVDVAILGLVTPVMLWRTAIWLRLNRDEHLPSAMTAKIAELEAENARLRDGTG